MIIFLFAIFGGLLGAGRARRAKGTRADIAQYAAGFAIAFAILGLFVTVIVSRVVS